MLPNNLEAWVFILIACFIGFVIGQRLKTRKNKVKTNDEYLNGLKRRILADTRDQTKKTRKKNRGINKKNRGLEDKLVAAGAARKAKQMGE
jgi:hypothetical protein